MGKDRMELIRLAGYVYEEKLEITNQYLIPGTLESHGVTDEYIRLEPEAISLLIRDYAREAGVRDLRKLLEKIVRKVALSMVRKEAESRRLANVTLENLKDYVGQPPFSSDRLFPEGTPPGVAMGLAWTALGGKALFVEARGSVPVALETRRGVQETSGASDTDSTSASSTASSPRGGARLKVTGKLGKVMNESSQ